MTSPIRTDDHEIDEYARAVVSRAIPAGKYHRLACARHLHDRALELTPGFPYRFDGSLADRFVRFAQSLRHYKGEWAGQFIVLQPFQRFRFGSIFGWVHGRTGLRRFRNAYHELPRKQGKSLEAAIVTLYVTFFDGEEGAEGYCAATKRGQALIVFQDCKKLVRSSNLRSRLMVKTSNISRETTNSKLEPLSADYNSMDGLNPNMVNIDEMHAHKTRGVIDVLETATGARRQPLINKITTAGNDPRSPCGDEHDYACKVLEGTLVDETYFAFIAHADPEDEWTSPETARKANPNYGISVNPEDLKGKVAKALGIPEAAATYKQKHLNLWVNTFNPCLSMDGWAKGQSTWREEELECESCWAGVDLSSKLDLTSISLLFPPTPQRRAWRLVQRIFTPADTLIERARRDRATYDVWVEQGWLRTSPGADVDYGLVREELAQLRARFDIETVSFDPWHASQLMRDMKTEDGWAEAQVLEVSQTFAGMTEAELLFKGHVLNALIDARRCPVTAWAASNVVEQTDGKGNILFSKKRSRGRIDPIKSATIALSSQLRQPRPAEPKILIVGGRHARP